MVDRALRERIRYEMPYPIAINYKRIGACPEPNAQRLMYVLKTAEMTARFLGIVALAELRRASPVGGLGTQGAELGDRLARPSFGTWLWITRACLAAIHGADAACFVAELDGFYYDGKRRPTPEAKQLDALCTTRNRFAHDHVAPDEWLQPREIPEACETSLAALENVLGKLLFLAERPLIVASPVIVEKRRDRAPSFTRNKIVMVGCADPFDVERDTTPELCETAEALLVDTASRGYLNLDPLVIYSGDGTEMKDVGGVKREVRTEIRDVFVFNGGTSGNRSYAACAKGGDLWTKELADRDHIEVQLAALAAAASSR